MTIREERAGPSKSAGAFDLVQTSRLGRLSQDAVESFKETLLITQLATRLLLYLGVGVKWLGYALRLALFSIFLAPGFIKVVSFYLRSSRIARNIRYGPHRRNFLDVYMPTAAAAARSAGALDDCGKGPQETPRDPDNGSPRLVGLRRGKPLARSLCSALLLLPLLPLALCSRSTARVLAGESRDSEEPPRARRHSTRARGGGEKGRTAGNNGRRTAPDRCPVVVFVPGGAWLIGYKAWGAMLGRELSRRGIVVVTPDYRNFPMGAMPDMVDDARAAMEWVASHAHEYGGDPENVTLIGQSAGAHISMMLAMVSCEEEAAALAGAEDAGAGAEAETGTDSSPAAATRRRTARWRASSLRALVAISGPFDLYSEMHHLEKRGLSRPMLHRMAGGADQVAAFSPSLRCGTRRFCAPGAGLSRSQSVPSAAALMPAVTLCHGTRDASCPHESSTTFAAALRRIGVPATVHLYDGKTHTDPIIEDPLAGRHALLADLLAVVRSQPDSGTEGEGEFLVDTPPPDVVSEPMCSLTLIRLARFVNPF